METQNSPSEQQQQQPVVIKNEDGTYTITKLADDLTPVQLYYFLGDEVNFVKEFLSLMERKEDASVFRGLNSELHGRIYSLVKNISSQEVKEQLCGQLTALDIFYNIGNCGSKVVTDTYRRENSRPEDVSMILNSLLQHISEFKSSSSRNDEKAMEQKIRGVIEKYLSEREKEE